VRQRSYAMDELCSQAADFIPDLSGGFGLSGPTDCRSVFHAVLPWLCTTPPALTIVTAVVIL